MRELGGNLVDRRLAVGVDVVDVHLHRLIDERELLAVGRPLRRIAEPCAERRHLAVGAGTVRWPERQLVLAAAVAPERERLAVGGPSRIPLGSPRAPGHVHDRAVFGGHGDHVTARLEHGALTRRRNARPVDQPVDLGRLRPQRSLVGDDAHWDLGAFLGLEIEQIQTRAGLEHDRVRADRRKPDVEIGEVGHLTQLAAGALERPDVVALVGPAIGDEVHRVPVPHRLRVVGGVGRQVLRRQRFEVEHPDVGRPSTAVAFPGAEVLRLRHVSEPAAVGRERAELAVGHDQFLGKAAVESHQVELVVTLASALARRGEENTAAIGMPPDHAVGAGVIGEARLVRRRSPARRRRRGCRRRRR